MKLVKLNQGALFEQILRAHGFGSLDVWASEAVYAECIAPTPAAQQHGHRAEERLRDMLWQSRYVTRMTAEDGDMSTPIRFKLGVVRDNTRPTATVLDVMRAGEDNGRPGIVYLFPEELDHYLDSVR